MFRYAVAVSAAVLIGTVIAGFAQTQSSAPCDPNASPTTAQVARRRLAISAARQVNTAEAKTWATTKRYAAQSIDGRRDSGRVRSAGVNRRDELHVFD